MGFLDNSRPLVFAHRGGCALGPENTLAAFDRGRAAGADGFELDVRLSADGVVVVCHDDTLDRTTGAIGLVRARTAADMAGVDAGHRFVDAAGGFPFRGLSIGVPTLRDVLERYRDVLLIVEMKEDTPKLGQAVGEAARAADAVERVCAAGYGQRSLDTVRSTLPDLATSADADRERFCPRAH